MHCNAQILFTFCLLTVFVCVFPVEVIQTQFTSFMQIVKVSLVWSVITWFSPSRFSFWYCCLWLSLPFQRDPKEIVQVNSPCVLEVELPSDVVVSLVSSIVFVFSKQIILSSKLFSPCVLEVELPPDVGGRPLRLLLLQLLQVHLRHRDLRNIAIYKNKQDLLQKNVS